MLVFEEQKLCVFEMPKTGTTWLRHNLEGWRDGTCLQPGDNRHGFPRDFKEGLDTDYTKVFIFREPIEWCISFWEYQYHRLNDPEDKIECVKGRTYRHWDLFPLAAFSQEEWWKFMLMEYQVGILKDYFNEFLNYANIVIPFPWLTTDNFVFHKLWTENETLPLNEGKHEWRDVPEMEKFKNAFRLQELPLFNRYKQECRRWEVIRNLA